EARGAGFAIDEHSRLGSHVDPPVMTELTLAELEASSGFHLAVLLALHHARVTREEASDLEDAAQVGLVVGQRTRYPVPHRAGLTGQAPARDSAEYVELVVAVGDQERLGDQHAQHGASKILYDLPVVHGDLA